MTMSASSFPTVLSEIFRLLSPAITEPHLSSVQTPKETNASQAASHHVKESVSCSEKQCFDASAFSSLCSPHSDGSSYPPVSGFGAAPLSWRPYIPDSSVPLVPSLLPNVPHSPWDFLFSKGEKARRKWRKCVHDHTMAATTMPRNCSTTHEGHSSGGPFLSLSSSPEWSHEGKEETQEEEEEEEDVVVSYFVKYSYTLSRLCSRASPCIARVPSLSPHSAVGGTSSPSLPGALESVSDTETSGVASSFFLPILHPQHHCQADASSSFSSLSCCPYSTAENGSPLDEIQRVREISTLLALLHRSRTEYEGNPAFSLFWRNVVEQRVGAQLLSSLEESWEVWKHMCTGATCPSYSSPRLASVDAAASDWTSSTALRTIDQEPFSERCMLYAEAFLFYTKHRVEELFDIAALHCRACPMAWPHREGCHPTASHVQTQGRETHQDEKTSSPQDDDLKCLFPSSFSFCPTENHTKREIMLVPGEDNDALLHRVFRLLREFAERKEGEPFQKRVTLLLLGVLCVWNRVSPLLSSLPEDTLQASADATTISTSGRRTDATDTTPRSPRPSTVALGTLQDELLQHFYQHFETTVTSTSAVGEETHTSGGHDGGGASRSTADAIGNEAYHAHNDSVLTLPSFFVALLLLQYPMMPSYPATMTGDVVRESAREGKGKASSWSCRGGEEKAEEKCPSLLTPSSEILEANLERWNQLAPLLTYGRMYDIDFTVIIEMDGTQSVLLDLLKELIGEVERAVWAQIHHPSWWSHFSFPSLLSVCRGISLFSYTWISCATCAIDPGTASSHLQGSMPEGVRWLFTYVRSAMTAITQEVCDAAWKRDALKENTNEILWPTEASSHRPPPDDPQAMQERSLYSFPSVWRNPTTTAPPSTPNPKAFGAAVSSPPLDVAAVSFIHQNEEKMNSYLALYAHLCGLFIEWDVDGMDDTGGLLFLPFSPYGEAGGGNGKRVDEPHGGGDGEDDGGGTQEEGAALANDTQSRKKGLVPTPTRLTPAALAAVDALFASSLSCSCPYSSSSLSPSSSSSSSSMHVAAPFENDGVVHIPLLPKYMMFLQHILQSPRLDQLLHPVSHGSTSVVKEVLATSSSASLSPPPSSSSAASAWTLSVSEGVFLESACTVLFSLLDVVDYFPDTEEDGDVKKEKTEKNPKGKTSTRKKRMLALLEAASGGIPLEVLLQQLFLLCTALRTPQKYVIARLFTCVERCYREVSKREGHRDERRRWNGYQPTLSSPTDLFPGQYPALSLPFLAAKVLLSPSLLQRLGESPGSACLGVLHAHLYGIFATLEQHKREKEEEEQNKKEEDDDHDDSLLPFPSSNAPSLPSMAHLLGCLTYLSPGQLSHHASTLHFYLTILRYLCHAASIFSVDLAEDNDAWRQDEAWKSRKGVTTSLYDKKGTADAVLSRQSPPPPPSLPQRKQRRWWWWWVEKDASRILCAYPSLLSTLMEAATALQGRVAAGYLYGVQGPLQGALERTWRLIAILTTTGRAHTLLANTVIPVVAHASLTASPSFSSLRPTDTRTTTTTASRPLAEKDERCEGEKKGSATTTSSKAGAMVFPSSSTWKRSGPHPYASHGHTVDIPALTLLLEVVFSSRTTFAPQTQLLCASLWCACLKSFAAADASASPYATSGFSSGGTPEVRSLPFHALRLSLGTTASRLLAALRPSFYAAGHRYSHPHHHSNACGFPHAGKANPTRTDEGPSNATSSSATTFFHAPMGSNGLLEKLVESLWMERGEVSNILRLHVLLALQRLDSRLLMQFLMASQFAAVGGERMGLPTARDGTSTTNGVQEHPPFTSLMDLRLVPFLHDVVHASSPPTKEKKAAPQTRQGSSRSVERDQQAGGKAGALGPLVHPQERALAWFLLLGMKLVTPSFFPGWGATESRKGKEASTSSQGDSRDGGGAGSILFPFSTEDASRTRWNSCVVREKGEQDTQDAPEDGPKTFAVPEEEEEEEVISGAALYQAAAGLHFWLSMWLAEKQQVSARYSGEEGPHPTLLAQDKAVAHGSMSSSLPPAPGFAPLPSSTSGPASATHQTPTGVRGTKASDPTRPTTRAASLLSSRKAVGKGEEDSDVLWDVIEKGMTQLAIVQQALSHYLPLLYRRDTSHDWWEAMAKETDKQQMAQLRFFFSSSSSSSSSSWGSPLWPDRREEEETHRRPPCFPAPTHPPRRTQTGSATSMLLYPLVLVSTSPFSHAATTEASASAIPYAFLQGLPKSEGRVWNAVASLLYSIPSYGYALEKAILFFCTVEVHSRVGKDGEAEDERGKISSSSASSFSVASPSVRGGRSATGKEPQCRWMSLVLIDLIATLLEAVGGSPFPAMVWLQEQCVATCFRLLHTMASTGFGMSPSTVWGGRAPPLLLSDDDDDDVSSSVPAPCATRPPSPVAGTAAPKTNGMDDDETTPPPAPTRGPSGPPPQTSSHRSPSFASTAVSCRPSFPSRASVRLVSAIRLVLVDLLSLTPWHSTVLLTNLLVLLRALLLSARGGERDGPQQSGKPLHAFYPTEGKWIMRRVIDVVARQLRYWEQHAREDVQRKQKGAISAWEGMSDGRTTGGDRPRCLGKRSRPTTARVFLRREREKEKEESTTTDSRLPQQEAEEEGDEAMDPTLPLAWQDTAKEKERDALLEAAHLFFITHGNMLCEREGREEDGLPLACGVSLRTMVVCLVHRLEDLAERIPVFGLSSKSNPWVARFMACVTFLETLVRQHPMVPLYLPKASLLVLTTALGQLFWMPPLRCRVRMPPVLPISCASASPSAFAPLQGHQYQRCAAQELWCAVLSLFRSLLTSGGGGGGATDTDSLLHPSQTGWMDVLQVLLCTPRFQWALSGFGSCAVQEQQTAKAVGRGTEMVGLGPGVASPSSLLPTPSPCMPLFIWDMEEWYLCMQLVSLLRTIGCPCFPLSSGKRFPSLVRCGVQEVHSPRFWMRFRVSYGGPCLPSSSSSSSSSPKGEETSAARGEAVCHPCEVEEEPVVEHLLAKWYVGHIIRDSFSFVALLPPSNGWPTVSASGSRPSLQCAWPSMFALLYRYIARQVRTVVQQLSFILSLEEEEEEEGEEVEKKKGNEGEEGSTNKKRKGGPWGSPPQGARASLRAVFHASLLSMSSSTAAGLTPRRSLQESSQKAVDGRRSHLLTSQRTGPASRYGSAPFLPTVFQTGVLSRTSSGSFQSLSRSRSASQCALSPSLPRSTSCSAFRLSALLEEVSLSMESIELAVTVLLKGGQEIVYHLQMFSLLPAQEAEMEGEFLQYGRRLVHTLESIEKGLPEDITSRQFISLLSGYRQHIALLLERIRVI